jgi:peptide chain release factor 1
MLPKYIELEKKFNELESQLQSPAVLTDTQKLKTISQEYNDLKVVVAKIQDLDQMEKNILQTSELLKTEASGDLFEMAKLELTEQQATLFSLEKELEELTRPVDPLDKKDVIIEIRAGVGGDESALFAAELYRMYHQYAEGKKWKTYLIDQNSIGIGGFKEVVFSIKGANVYKDLKYEMGVHRVQRVPETEKSGRIHTSTVTVAVLPEIENTTSLKPPIPMLFWSIRYVFHFFPSAYWWYIR